MIQEFVEQRETGKEGPGSSGKWHQCFGILSQALENAALAPRRVAEWCFRQKRFGFLTVLQNTTRWSPVRFIGNDKSSGRYGCVNCSKGNSWNYWRKIPSKQVMCICKKYRNCKECLIFFPFLCWLPMQVCLAGFSFFSFLRIGIILRWQFLWTLQAQS